MGSEEETTKVDEQKALVSLLKEDDLEESPLKPLTPKPQEEEAAEDGDEKMARNCEGTEEEVAENGDEKMARNCEGTDWALATVEMEKRLALIKAWEDNEKTKVDNKAHKKLASVDAWENTKRAYVDAQLKQIEENFETKKAEHREKMKNKMAVIHRNAEEMRATVTADREHAFFTVQEASNTFRATGRVPKKLFACFGH